MLNGGDPPHWDRNRARSAVGEGFPFLLFRLPDGFPSSPWLSWIPFPGATPCALTCFFHSVIGLPQAKIGSAVSVYPTNNDFSQARVSRMQIFRTVPASKFAHPPDRPYRCEYIRRAAGAFTSGPIVLCYLHTHRIY